MSIIQVNTIRSRSGTSAPTFDQGINVTGIATLGAGSTLLPALRISNGIVTSTTGIITYYGDGQYLSNIGIGVTYIPNNISIVGVTTVNSLLNVGSGVTINTQGISVTGVVSARSYTGSGSSLTGIVTSIVAGSDITIVSSGATPGTGIVTVSVNQNSLFTNKAVFTPTLTGIATTSSVSIGTTIATHTLTVNGTISAGQTVTAPGFQGVASTATTVNVVSSGSSSEVHYLNFTNSTSGNEEIRTDSGLKYYPSSETLFVTNINAPSGIITSSQLQVGTDGSSIISTGIGSIGIKNQYPRYPLEIGGLGETEIVQYINGSIQTTKEVFVGAGVSAIGIITASNFSGSGSGLVGVGSTVQLYYTEITSSTTWTLPSRINWVLVQCIGGGGSGTVRGTGSGGPGGGGSGAVVTKVYNTNPWRVLGVTNFQVFVGTGGTSSTTTTGNNGGDSKFEVSATDYLLAPGGKGASSSTGGEGGEGISGISDGIFSATGASGNGDGNNSLYGPGSGGTRNGTIGGRCLSSGTTGPAGIGTGGIGGNGSTIIATNGQFPGGGGGGSTSGTSGGGGGGCVRIWGW